TAFMVWLKRSTYFLKKKGKLPATDKTNVQMH
ncbi:hypothetical protein D043_0486B, partial [Vibrio parahaemolyticus EKP-021]